MYIYISHTGMIFYTGPQIPNYNPDHGPTHADSKHDLAIFPPNMIQFTERWLDPMYGMDTI